MHITSLMLRSQLWLAILSIPSLWAYTESAKGVEEGGASYYADSLHGNKTASGEV